ncbi:MAG: L-seryl-tRNA(Sec) selenium transferase [Chloroflexi bacterium]|nr:L-seryl-tRNA(Sec) selenium transferase [Chloroflexota bacterium]
MANAYRSLPSVDKLLADRRLRPLEAAHSRQLVTDAVRQVLEAGRSAIARGEPAPTPDQLVASVVAEVESLAQISLRSVINATGVVLHTNLGRAPLSRETTTAMDSVSGYINLEFDVANGARGSREVHLSSLLCRLTGAEAALVVNNNASAVLLALSALAKRKEVIVSRGQAVEIGGGFRIPDVMRQSGARLVEVGTTNCTYLSDYEEAITDRTAALLRVHSSNFKVVGFTQEVGVDQLVQLGARHDLPVLDDLGSGCLLDTSRFGLAPEPTVQDSIAAGVALAFFSGDKLLGGPQAGIVVGQRYLIEKLRKHPLARAVRIDKTRIAGLAATLLHYLKGQAEQRIPVWQMISLHPDEVESRAREWAAQFKGLATVTKGESVVGGGSLPGGTLPTWLLTIKGTGKAGQRIAVQELAARLRAGQPPVVGRLEGNSLLLDPRTVRPEDDRVFIEALRQALDSLGVRPDA